MKAFFFLCTTLFTIYLSKAQQISCGTDNIHRILSETDVKYAKMIAQQNLNWSRFVSSKENRTIQSQDAELQIPVVFHVLHTGQPIGTIENPSDMILFDLVEELNHKYSATWQDFPSVADGGVAVPIQFKLARRTPDCQPSNGINRIDASAVPQYINYGMAYGDSANGASELDLKALSVWPNTEYLNIWIVTTIQGGWAGFAYYPGSPPTVDGIVLHCNYLNWALAHEVGHSLGLHHTFSGSSDDITCPANNDCTLDGDMVCDTEPHPLVQGCSTGINICTGNSFEPVVYNIMNYSYCPNRFTPGQRDRMLFMFDQYRHLLSTSEGANLPGENLGVIQQPISACIPGSILFPDNIFDMGLRNVSFANMFYSSSGYGGDGNQHYIDHTTIKNCMMQPQLFASIVSANTYTLTVTTGFNTENVHAWIDYNNNGEFENNESILYSLGTISSQTHVSDITIPTTAVHNIPLRMRVASDYSFSPIPQSCATLQYGQTEDFAVIISTLGNSVVEKILTAVYPNPVVDFITIPIDLEVDYKIYSLIGTKVGNGKLKPGGKIFVGDLSSGVYLLHVGGYAPVKIVRK